MEQTAEKSSVVEMRNIKKNFAAVQALRGVDLALHRTEVLGLVGDNAAGKSTLMKVLSGAYIPDGGEILIEGEKVSFANPMDARRQGQTLDGTNNVCERSIGWWIKERYRSMRGYKRSSSALNISRLTAYCGNRLNRGGLDLQTLFA